MKRSTSATSARGPRTGERGRFEEGRVIHRVRVVGTLLCAVTGLSLASLPRGQAKDTAVDVTKLPPPASTKVDFDKDIKPIFESTCYRCHGTERPKSGFSLITRASALKGGDNGVDIVPGQSAQSPLIHYVARLVPDMEMPPEGKGQPLAPEQIGLLRAWIDQGAPWSAQPEKPQQEASLTTGAGRIGVSGNKNQFREHAWEKDGWSGGATDFHYKDVRPNGDSLTFNGHAIANQNDYLLDLTLEKRNLGYARAGFQEYSKYFNDAGGDYTPNALAPYKLDRDLQLNIGKAWAELGLTVPHWPRVVLGYEFDFRDGERSTLEWAPVGTTADLFDPANNPKNIYPSYQSVDEKTHVIKLDITHDLRGFFLEDEFRGEFYSQNDTRQNAVYYQVGNAGPDKYQFINETYQHFQGANAFRIEKKIKDWLFVSGGYLYSRLSGDAGFNLNTVLTPFVPPPTPGTRFDPFWFSQSLVLDQQSHVFNANTMWGPWQGLLFTAGIQNEWMSQQGFGRVRLDEGDPALPGPGFAQPATLDSNYDKFSSEENFAVRYTKIPWTVLFADARFRQDTLGQFEEQSGGVHDFLDQVDATSNLSEFRTGFSISPWQSVALNAHYRHSYEKDDYNYLTDLTRAFGAPQPITSYPGFITSRSMFTDEIETKLILKPVTWFKTSLSYQLLGTDFHTTTRSVSFNAPGDISPGGDLFAGKYDAHVYSANFTVVPLRRLYFTSTISYSDASTATPISNQGGIVPYRGNVFTLFPSVTYLVSDATELSAGYSFSRANYGQNNYLNGLPLGLTYDWHSLHASISHRFTKRLSARLQYAFMDYHEPASNSANDYTAHGIFASVTIRWP